ncbi:hypothetical protein Goklo_011851 [Gossypium klotzschianum]|uniref:Uncharacterized protein n=1 Tax=Gossypium klotzschianum TaxID=34286 RepID=A0A7J8VAB7_9ROSI|nr:hypothetical protein [Gossypium klotzschianum]
MLCMLVLLCTVGLHHQPL